METVLSVFGVKPFRIGGTETFARELSSQLGERGYRHVLCFLAEPADNVKQFLTASNVTVEVLENSTRPNWNSIKRLAQIIRKYNPSLLHLHFTGFIGAYPWIARALSVKKIVFTDHSSRPAGYVEHRAPWWKRLMTRWVNGPVTKVVCVSQYGERCLTSLDLLPRSRHELIYNAVDLSRVVDDDRLREEFRKKYSIPADRTVIAQVSWMIPEKGIPELLETARELLSMNSNFHLVLVGEGAHREEFMRTATQMGLADNITWTGLVADPFGEGVFAAADIVCQLSKWEELFGWMIAEAMAYGKPIIATNVGGIPELVQDGITGFLVERGDHSAAARKLDELARDPDLRASMGAAGRRVVEEKFNLKRNVAQLVRLYGI